MLPIVTTLGSTSPSGVFDGLTVRHAVWASPYSSALRWVSPPAILTCSSALRLVSPTTMASADFWPDRSRQISPGKGTMLPCATTAFTSTGKPDDFAVLCQLVVPYRRCRAPPRPPCGQPCRAGCLAPLGSMRFLSIGSQVSPSLPSHGRSPFRSWLQMVVSSFSCSGFPTGDLHPIYIVPMLGTHKTSLLTPDPPPVPTVMTDITSTPCSILAPGQA
jgi:hypothetical protein